MSGHSTYEPKTGFERWMDMRLPILRMAHDTALTAWASYSVEVAA